MIKKIRIILWSLVAVLLAYMGYAYITVKDMNGASPLSIISETELTQQQAQDAKEKSAEASFTPVAGLMPQGSFTLTNQDGELFTQDSAAWNAPYKLVYFGFTYCPMICPTELQKITKSLNDLPKDKQDKIQPVFISIDPERDTPESLKQYLSSFYPRFIGLTGTPEQIKHMADMWKVYYKKIEDDSLNGYTMDHSSYIYLQNANGQILGLFRIKDTAANITKYLNKTVD